MFLYCLHSHFIDPDHIDSGTLEEDMDGIEDIAEVRAMESNERSQELVEVMEDDNSTRYKVS